MQQIADSAELVRTIATSLENSVKATAKEGSKHSHPVHGFHKDWKLIGIPDTDRDFDAQLEKYEHLRSNMRVTGRPLTPNYALLLFRDNFAKNSLREMLFDTLLKEAYKKGRVPDDSAAVLDEMIIRFKSESRESDFRKRQRLKAEFDALVQGSKRHFEFKIQLEQKVGELVTMEEWLKEEYLKKISHELRKEVIADMIIDGKVLGPPKIWRDVADRCDHVTKLKLDSQNPVMDRINAVGAKKCSKCNGIGNMPNMCPNTYAAPPAEGAAVPVCNTCQGQGHCPKDHARVLIEKVNKMNEQTGRGQPRGGGRGGGSKGKGKGDSKGKGKGKTQEQSQGNSKKRCPAGAKCKSLLETGVCSNWHPDGEFRAAHKTAMQQAQGQPERQQNVGTATPEAKAKAKAKSQSRKAQSEPESANQVGQYEPGICRVCGKAKAEHAGGWYCSSTQEGTTPSSPRKPKGGGKTGKGKGRGKGRGRGGGAGGPAGGAASISVLTEGGRESLNLMCAEGSGPAYTWANRQAGVTKATDLISACMEKYRAGPQPNPKTVAKGKGKNGKPRAADMGDLLVEPKTVREVVARMSAVGRIAYKRLSEVPSDWIHHKKRAQPVGYAALTWVSVGGYPVEALLDSGASVSAISEEILLVILDLTKSTTLSQSDPRYPFQGLEKYEQGSPLIGIDTSGAVMQTEYGVTLAIEFIPKIGSKGDGKNRVENMYFKVLPKGVSDFKGLFFGFPALDYESHGLGWKIHDGAHFFQAYRVWLTENGITSTDL